MVSNELEVYAAQTAWLLGEYLANLRALDERLLLAAPPAVLEGNNLLAIAKHAAGVTRAYVLGLGCGHDVGRDRSTEFTATAAECAGIVAAIESLPGEITAAFAALDTATLDRRLLPAKALWGTGDPTEMTGREAIVHNVRHLGIHLGELRLTRSLLESAARA